MKKCIIICLLTAGIVQHMSAQKRDSVYRLSEVEIIEPRHEFFGEDKKILLLDSFIIQKNQFSSVSELLSWSAPVNIRQYGSGGALSNISMRGSSASQIQVNWNGFPLNSITAGSSDLSLYSAGAVDKVAIHWGTSGSLYGSAFGAVNLKNTPTWNRDNQYTLFAELGSFNSQKYGTDIRIGNEKVQYKLNASYHKSDDDFKYDDTNGTEIRREHNELTGKSLSQFLYFKLLNKNFLDVGFWMHNKKINLPFSLMQEGVSEQKQEDEAIRTFIRWEKLNTRSKIGAKVAYFDTFLKYENPAYDYTSEIKTKQIFGDVEYRNYLSKSFVLDFSGKYSLQTAEVADYENKAEEHNFSASGALKYKSRRLTMIFSGRADLNSQENPKPQFSIGGKLIVFPKKLFLKANYSSQFRLPAFNDKYWNPGGNKNLLPEEAWTGELGVEYNLINKPGNKFTMEATLFQSKVKNLIAWFPVENEFFYSPVNIGKVNKKGWEFMAKYEALFTSKFRLNTRLSYSYVHAKDKTTDQLLFYVPKHQGILFSGLSYEKFFFTYSLRYTDKVSTSDFTEGIDDYFVSDLFIGKIFNLKKVSVKARLSVRNLFNKQYQTVLNYPVPGRNFRISLFLRF